MNWRGKYLPDVSFFIFLKCGEGHDTNIVCVAFKIMLSPFSPWGEITGGCRYYSNNDHHCHQNVKGLYMYDVKEDTIRNC